MGLLADADATLIHKDFAKSTGWQIIAFDLCVCIVLYGALKFLGHDAWAFVQASIGTLAAVTFAVLWVNIKKMQDFKKEGDK